MIKQKYNSFAKINLGLQVLNKRDDGYHNINSIFLEINLSDHLYFHPSPKYKLIAKKQNDFKLPLDETNLISKAYVLMKNLKHSKVQEYEIQLIKNIPLGSGLGGGSSNAAATIKILNKLWKINFDKRKLEILSKKLGADVPFFIKGGLQHMEGIGDILTPQNMEWTKNLHFILINPNINISTKWAYNILNKSLQPNNRRPKFPALSESMNWELFDNDFERVIHETYPEIGKIKALLRDKGALYSGLSGSGSTVFGVFDNLHKAESILGLFDQYQTFLSAPVFR